jgi:hypothetical protein
VILIKNKENTGGSGGFNTGMKEALKKDYRYLYLLDNDIILHENALTELYDYLESHQNVGIAGSLLYSMDNPTEIQELGAKIDWDNFIIKPNLKGSIDLGVPKELECDYVPCWLEPRQSKKWALWRKLTSFTGTILSGDIG